jgi:hypothetical protein
LLGLELTENTGADAVSFGGAPKFYECIKANVSPVVKVSISGRETLLCGGSLAKDEEIAELSFFYSGTNGPYILTFRYVYNGQFCHIFWDRLTVSS